jgi:hypothetical protein
MWMKAIKARQLPSAEAVSKYITTTEAITMGQLDQHRMNTNSTQPRASSISAPIYATTGTSTTIDPRRGQDALYFCHIVGSRSDLH